MAPPFLALKLDFISPFQAYYLATLGASERLCDAYTTWHLLGEPTNLPSSSSGNFITSRMSKYGRIRSFQRCTRESLTYVLTGWAERTLVFPADHIHENYVRAMVINCTTGMSFRPWGTIDPAVVANESSLSVCIYSAAAFRCPKTSR